MKTKRKVIIALIILLLSVSGAVLSRTLNSFSEWYANNVYSILTVTIGKAAGLVPFSIVEFVLYGLIICFVISIIRTIIRFIKEKRRNILFSYLGTIFLVVSVILFQYVFACGINYNRDTFSSKENLSITEYTADDLENICTALTENVNALSTLVERDNDGNMMLSEDERETSISAMTSLSETYLSLKGFYPSAKRIAFSQAMSYMGISGIYTPFFIEANYNNDMPDYNKPFTVCHELSHLRGFMNEEEANYIAFLACINSDSVDFKYSGYLSAITYCINALKAADIDAYNNVISLISDPARHDMSANSEFWNAYDGTISDLQTSVNDTYLKSHGTADGVNSYGRMVDLIVSNPELIPKYSQ